MVDAVRLPFGGVLNTARIASYSVTSNGLMSDV